MYSRPSQLFIDKILYIRLLSVVCLVSSVLMVIVGAAVLICFLDSMFEVLQGPQTDRPWKHFDSDRDSRDSDSILMMRLRFCAPATVFSAGKHSRPPGLSVLRPSRKAAGGPAKFSYSDEILL